MFLLGTLGMLVDQGYAGCEGCPSGANGSEFE